MNTPGFTAAASLHGEGGPHRSRSSTQRLDGGSDVVVPQACRLVCDPPPPPRECIPYEQEQVPCTIVGGTYHGFPGHRVRQCSADGQRWSYVTGCQLKPTPLPGPDPRWLPR